MSHSICELNEGFLSGYLNISTGESSLFSSWKTRYVKLIFRPTTSTLIISKSANVPALSFIDLSPESKVDLVKYKRHFCIRLELQPPHDPKDIPLIFLSPFSMDVMLVWLDAVREGIHRLGVATVGIPSVPASLHHRSKFSVISSRFPSEAQREGDLYSLHSSFFAPTLDSPIKAKHQLDSILQELEDYSVTTTAPSAHSEDVPRKTKHDSSFTLSEAALPSLQRHPTS